MGILKFGKCREQALPSPLCRVTVSRVNTELRGGLLIRLKTPVRVGMGAHWLACFRPGGGTDFRQEQVHLPLGVGSSFLAVVPQPHNSHVDDLVWPEGRSPGMARAAGSSFVNLTQVRVTWKDGPATAEMPPLDWPVGHFLG